MSIIRSFGVHLGQRFHAFGHGLFRSQDQKEAAALYERALADFENCGMLEDNARERLINDVALEVARVFDISDAHPRYRSILKLAEDLFRYEQLFLLPEIDWTEKRETSEWWALRDELIRQKRLCADFQDSVRHIGAAVEQFVRAVGDAAPLFNPPATTNDLTVEASLLHCLNEPKRVVQNIVALAFDKDLKERGLFVRLQAQLARNLIAASGGNPRDPQGFTRTPLPPEKSSITDPHALAEAYLAATPLIEFLAQDIDFIIPTESRFEHTHIVAGSGHGKSQTLQYLISEDFDAVAQGKRSVVVLDSQGDLIKNIVHLAEFAPGGRLHDRLVLIDPSDVEWPVSLNLFDVGVERLQSYEPLERERLTNSILELYDFVLGTLLSAEMTQKQNVIFRYVTRLMLHVPDATIHTLRELMEPDSHLKFAPHIEKLGGTARRFFETEFKDKEFAATKKQVLRRLWGILENQTFERMFSHPRSKLDLFAELNSGKIILINTAKDLLKEQGSEIFGRFFIALIAQAAQERATLPDGKRIPTFVYIDEAADYFDRNIGTILAQARKYKVGMVLAHQFLGQLPPALLDAFAANTSIKLAGGVSNKDARALASMLRCDPEFIEGQPKGSFAASVRGLTASAVPLQFPLGHLERRPRMNDEEWQALRSAMRAEYAVHFSVLETVANTTPTTSDPSKSASTNTTKRPTPPEDINIEPTENW
jgi:hypothetical protein